MSESEQKDWMPEIVQVARLAAGETLVIGLREMPTQAAMKSMVEGFKEAAPNNKVVLLSGVESLVVKERD